MAIGTPTERIAASVVTATTTTSKAFSPATTVAAGSKAIFMVTANGNKLITSVTDSVGNTWAVDASIGDGTRALSICSAQVATQITSSDTITVNWTGSATVSLVCSLQEVTGLATASAFDKTANGQGASTTPTTSATATLSQGDEIVFCFERNNAGSPTFTAGAGYTGVTTPDGSTSAGFEYKIVSVTTAVSGAATVASSTWNMLLATYKMASAAVVTTSDFGLLGVG